jgi:hypothetical protein
VRRLAQPRFPFPNLADPRDHPVSTDALPDFTGLPALTTWLPILTPSSANLREHRAVRAARVKRERAGAYLRLSGAHFRGVLDEVRDLLGAGKHLAVIRLTRQGGQRLDRDNLEASFKAVQDGIAERMGFDDGDARLAWFKYQCPGTDVRPGTLIEVRVVKRPRRALALAAAQRIYEAARIELEHAERAEQ